MKSFPALAPFGVGAYFPQDCRLFWPDLAALINGVVQVDPDIRIILCENKTHSVETSLSCGLNRL